MAAPPRELRVTVGEIAGTLRGIHKCLIDLASGAYERENGPLGSPFVLFRLLTTDPRFAWIRPLTELTAAIDELLDRPAAIARRDGEAVRAELEDLLGATEGDRGQFLETYLEILQADPDVVIEHGRLMTQVRELPSLEPTERAELLRVRHGWSPPRTRRTAN
ncbi:MAG: hypothetical protein EXR73_10005 [Myxococcales bacterium]|nr:hypothetical protein [Myxococcales bacterium]